MVACRIPRIASGRFARGEANQPECRMRAGIIQLVLQREQPTPEHFRFGQIELVGEPLEPPPLGGNQVDLDGSRFPDTTRWHFS
jgi:hypothetical protein